MVTVLGHQHMGQQAGTGQSARYGAAGCAGLEDGMARHAGQLGTHMPDHLEVGRHVLQLFGDILSYLTQSSATSGAPAGLAICVLVRVADLGQVLPNIARQVRGQTAVDLRVIGGGRCRCGLGSSDHRGLATIDQSVVSLTPKGDEFTSKAIEYIVTNEDSLIEDMKDDYFLFRG